MSNYKTLRRLILEGKVAFDPASRNVKRIGALTPEELQAWSSLPDFDHLSLEAFENEGGKGFDISWGKDCVGFGHAVFHVDPEGNFTVDDEYMGIEFVLKALQVLLLSHPEYLLLLDRVSPEHKEILQNKI